MKKPLGRILGLVALLTPLGCATTGPEDAPDALGHEAPPRHVPRTAEDHARLVGYFPDTPLSSEDGSRVHFCTDLVRDKRVLINFMYTSCEDT